MFIGNLNQTQPSFFAQDPWPLIFNWISNASKLPDGDHTIQGNNIFANICEVTTQPRSQTKFESHTQHIDLPDDAHMPKISDNSNQHVRKIVVKIKMIVLS
jgi:YhcH/YjgK/YiaL family protein